MKKTLVLGASLNKARYSNLVMNKLILKGEEVFALGKESGFVGQIEIKTEKIYIKDLDTITLYLNAERQKEYYNYIIELKPKRVIFNPGTENPELENLLVENGINYELSCTLVLLSTNQY